MGLQTAKDQWGIAKQASKGTIFANPQFAHGLEGGGLSVDPKQEPDALTSAYLSPAGAYRSQIDTSGAITTRAFQKAIGLYLLGALGAVSVTGAGPYTHTITLGTSVPYLSLFEKKGDNTILGVKDAKVDELEISWEGNSPVEVKAKMIGGVFSFPATFTPTNDECDTVNYYVPVGGSFKYDLTTSTPVTASVTAGKILIKRGVQAKFFSGSIEAQDTWEGACSVEVSLTVLPDDMTIWRKALTGAVGGTSLATTPQYGSYEVQFTKGADSLKLAAANVSFLTSIPEADPQGGAAEHELAGTAYRAAGTPLTATLVNTVAAY